MKMGMLVLLAVGVVASSAAMAQTDPGFRVRVGLAIVPEVIDIGDFYADTYEETYNNTHRYSQADAEAFVIPIGIQVGAIFKFAYGGRMDLLFGPAVIMLGDAEYTDIPFSFTLGHEVEIGSRVALYARGGVAAHFVSGDYDPQSTPGFVAAVGAEFLHDRKASVGVELGVDTTKVDFRRYNGTREEFNAHGVMLSIFAAI
jgi:hypothetical protein